MRVFDKIDPQVIERREFHLGLLAISVIAIMATGLATFMYLTVFSSASNVENEMSRRVFVAFCALSALMIGYLLNRQVVIHRLRVKLAEDQKRLTEIRNQASSDLLKTLPGMNSFQDRLAMDFRRCAKSGEPLSVLTVVLDPCADPADTRAVTSAYGDAAKAILLKMRKGESLYLFESGAFGVVLPELNAISAALIGDRFSNSLIEAAKSGVGFASTIRVINYPDELSTARELEQAVLAALPISRPTLPTLNGSDSPMREVTAA